MKEIKRYPYYIDWDIPKAFQYASDLGISLDAYQVRELVKLREKHIASCSDIQSVLRKVQLSMPGITLPKICKLAGIPQVY